VEVMFYEEALDVSCMPVTPACSKGALGTWRPQGGPRTLSRGESILEAGDEFVGKPAWAGCTYVSA
jgi:hypothetical protein